MSASIALIFLFAAIVTVPIAKHLRLGSVLGFLAAGVIVGPYALNLVGQVSSDLLQMAEFGVVMMLFVIGLELRPSRLWQLRRTLLALGGAQMGITALIVAGASVALGLAWQPAVATGFILALSSTAVVLQSLAEKGLLKTPAGEVSFAVLLFQDIAVIPLIAALPLLATLPKPVVEGVRVSAMSSLSAGQHALLILGAIAILILASRFLVRPFFRLIAATGLREMFTAATLFLVLGIVLLMKEAGLSPALGSFLGGVLLADSEYRVQLETDIEPFKGLLLGLFFMTVGASIDFSLIDRQPGTVALLVIGMILLKFVALLITGGLYKLQLNQNLLFAFALAQGGEFAFVLFSLATARGVLSPELSHLLTATVALSMAMGPLLLLINERIFQPRFKTLRAARKPDVISEQEGNPVIVAGFGRFGHVVGRLLLANGFPTTVLDHDPDQVDTLRRFGLDSFYGDASRLDLLHAAGASNARLLVVAVDDEAKAKQIVQLAQKHFPHLKILVRATSRQHAYELIRLNVSDVFRETFGSALDLSHAALRFLGVNERRAVRAVAIFREHDEASVRSMAALDEKDDAAYVSTARQHSENLHRALQSDQETLSSAVSADPSSARS